MPRLSLRALTRPHVILSIVGVLMLVVLVIQGLLIRQLYIRTDQFGMSDLKEVLIESIKGLDMNYEPKYLRFFQARFEKL